MVNTLPTLVTTAIIPVRLEPSAKERLAPVFDANTRKMLVPAMLEDVINAIEAANGITRVLVISQDEPIRSLVTARGHDLFTSPVRGLNEELTTAIRLIESQGVHAVVIILADLPLLTGKVLDSFVYEG